jgi:hypothetical protein
MRIKEKRKFLFLFSLLAMFFSLFRLCFSRFWLCFSRFSGYVFLAFGYVFLAFGYVFLAFHFFNPCYIRVSEGSITRTKTETIKNKQTVVLFLLLSFFLFFQEHFFKHGKGAKKTDRDF